MKKALLIGCLWLISLAGISQTALYVTLSTPDFGVGYRMDHRMGNVGVYTSATKGNYQFYDDIYIKDHVRISIGGMVFVDDNGESQSFLTAGISYHSYGEKAFPDGFIKTSVFTPLSPEVGCGIRIGKFTSAVNLDVIKFDVNINFGVVFK